MMEPKVALRRVSQYYLIYIMAFSGPFGSGYTTVPLSST